MITSAFIKIWGERAGAVAWDINSGLASFEYDEKFRRNGWDLAPLKMPLQEKKVFSFPELRLQRNSDYDTFKGLPGLLADALPDKYGNSLINAWLAQNGRPRDSLNPVELLCFIGSRGMGALEFEPAQIKTSQRPFNLELDSLVEIAKQLLDNRNEFETQLTDQKAMLEVLKIGTSAGGARPKAIIAYNQKTGKIKSGQTKTPSGYDQWLIKLDGVSNAQFGESNGYGRVEMAYYLMAKDCGIDIMESQLIEENGRAHFLTKRFDRGNDKSHIQTFCAMEHFDFNEVNQFSYEQLFQTMRQLRLPYPEAQQQFIRMAFNVIARNCDDHTKNFAFRLKKDQNWELAPAYDICHAYRPGSQWVSQHSLSVNGKRKAISDDDLITLAKNMNIKKPKHHLALVKEVVGNWKTYAETVKVNSKLSESISKTLERQ